MRSARTAACLAIACLVPAVAGCAGNSAEGSKSYADVARGVSLDAKLQTVMVTVVPVAQDLPRATADELVAAMQAKDPAHRYTTTTPVDAGSVQVVGGGGGPVMYVVTDPATSSGRDAIYAAAWQGQGSTAWYDGSDPPEYSADVPSADGWGDLQ